MFLFSGGPPLGKIICIYVAQQYKLHISRAMSTVH